MACQITDIQEQVCATAEAGESLLICGGKSKAFLGRTTHGNELDMSIYSGIISYEPTELYITVKAGTLLSEVNDVLAEQEQMLAFEPAQVTDKTTIGGVVAVGLSGPGRPYSGSVRDFVLGIRCINGLGKSLSFGGQVMKNVAGYDLSRLLTGSYGTLGIILEVTLKVLPKAEYEVTVYQDLSASEALENMHHLAAQAVPLSASCYEGERLHLRFSGNRSAVNDILEKLDFNECQEGKTFWKQLRDYSSSFFQTKKPVWRLSVPSTAEIDLKIENYMIDWGGAQYWIETEKPAQEMFSLAEKVGGSAMLFLNGNREENIFQPLKADLFGLHQGLKLAFDPKRILNPGRMYVDI